MARTHAHQLARTARLSVVTGLGAAVLASAFALPASAEPVNAVQRGQTKIVAAQNDQKRKKVVVKQGDTLSRIAKKAKLSSWRPVWDLNKKIKHPNLIYPGQKLLLPAKGEKLKHRPLPALAVTRVVSSERSAAPAKAPGARPSPGRPRPGRWQRLGPPGPVRVRRQLGHQHRERLLRRPPVRPGHLGRKRRQRLGRQRQPRRADPRRRARPSLPGLGRLARLLEQARPPVTTNQATPPQNIAGNGAARGLFGLRAAPALRLRLLHDPAGVAARLPCWGAAGRWRAPAPVGQPGPPQRRGGRGAAGRRRRLRRRLPGGARGAAGLGGDPGAGARPGRSRTIGRIVEENTEALAAAGHPRGRQAARRGAAARSRRSSTPATSSSARAGGCTARRCRARCPTSSCSPSGCRSGWPPVITAGNFPVAVPSWYLVPALLCGNAVVWKPAEYAAASAPGHVPSCSRRPACPTACCNLVHADGPTTFDGLAAALEERPGRQGRLHRLHRGRACASASCAAVTCSRRAWSWAARTRWWSRPTPTSTWPSRARCSAASARPGSAAPRWARSSSHESVHDEFLGTRSRPPSSAAAIGDPPEDVLYGPMLAERFADRLRGLSGAGSSRTTRCSARPGPAGSPPPTRAPGFVGDPDRGLFYHPVIVDGVTPDDELFRQETFGPIVGVAASTPWTRRSSWPTARLRTVVVRSTPPTRRRRSASAAGVGAGMVVGQQLDLRAPRRTCRSAATAAPATAPPVRASGCSTSSPAGSR